MPQNIGKRGPRKQKAVKGIKSGDTITGRKKTLHPRKNDFTVASGTKKMYEFYLVTEYGIVNLKGKSTRERALDIISIAHPKFRDDRITRSGEHVPTVNSLWCF